MATAKRRVSPRAPSLALDEAISRTLRMYDAEGTHATSVEVALRHMGYSGKNGAALQTIASLGYWGLVERPRDGVIKVAKSVEDYKYTPDMEHKRSLTIGFLRNPKVFAQLLEKYRDRLPSDGTLQYELIQAGFTPTAASTCLAVFKRSVEYVGYFERPSNEVVMPEVVADRDLDRISATVLPAVSEREPVCTPEAGMQADLGNATARNSEDVDRIPIKLPGGRRAWLEIPSPFYSADRVRLKKHIDLLLADDEDDDSENHRTIDE